MTEQGREIQELKQTICRLYESLDEFVKVYECCRLCKRIDADCSPTGTECDPEWGGQFW